MERSNGTKGFTLLEILVVMVILGVLGSIVVPRFLNQSKRAQVSEALQMIGSMQRVADSYLDANGPSLELTESSGAASWEKFGMADPNVSKLWRYRVSIVSGRTATLYAIYLADGLGGYYVGPTTYMRLQTDAAGTESWDCGLNMQTIYSSTDAGTKKAIGCRF